MKKISKEAFIQGIEADVGRGLGTEQNWRFVVPDCLLGQITEGDVLQRLRLSWDDAIVDSAATTTRNFCVVPAAFLVYFQ
jgi:hypothetical protein